MTIRCVVFDFDGTLVRSVAIKHDSYFAAVADIPGGAEIFRGIIQEFPRMTRYDGCALFVENPGPSSKSPRMRISSGAGGCGALGPRWDSFHPAGGIYLEEQSLVGGFGRRFRDCCAGLGERFPVASNDNEAGRSQNRRVEMYVRN